VRLLTCSLYGGEKSWYLPGHAKEISDRLKLQDMYKIIFKKLSFAWSLVVPMVVFSCAPSPIWVNPISPVNQTDKRLPGAWRLSEYPVLFIGAPVDGWMSFVISRRENPEPKILGRFYVSELEGRKFLNVKIHSPWNLSDCYLIAEYKIEKNGNLFVALANHDFVRKAIQHGRLAGRIEENDSGGEILVLSCDSSDISAFIKESPKESLFPQSPSDVLKRFR
jgi:hypothetical protein